MMRNRAWRRHMEEIIVKRRLKNQSGRWYYFSDVNNISIKDPIWSDSIGTYTQHMYKTYTTKKNDSNHKIKYSPNRNKGYWRRNKNKIGTREEDRIKFRKMLKNEYGIAHFNTEC